MLQLEGISAGLIFGGVAAFYALYAIQLGANNAVIGWLTSAPALLSLFWQLPVSRLIARFRGYRAPILIGVLLQRALVMALAAVIWLPPAWRPWGAVVLVALAALPSSLWGVAFQSAWVVMFSPRRLARTVGARWAVASVTVMLSVYLLGLWLDWIPFPLNFQLMFLGVSAISLASFWIMIQFRFPPLHPDGPASPAQSAQPHERFLTVLRRHRPFVVLELTAFVAYLAIYGAVPLFRIYWVRDLQANATWIGILTAASSVGGALGNWLWGRWSQPLRNRRNALIAGLGVAAGYPLLTAAFDSLAPLIVVSLLAGFTSGGSELMLLNRSMELSSRQHLPTFVAIYATTIHLASFLAPLATTLIADYWGTRAALALVGGVGLAGVLLVYFFGWGKPAPAGAEAP